jgi:hypothetical protein
MARRRPRREWPARAIPTARDVTPLFKHLCHTHSTWDGWIWNQNNFQRYCTVRLGAPYKFRILHSKISHETNKQWVRYGTMQSESTRSCTKYIIPGRSCRISTAARGFYPAVYVNACLINHRIFIHFLVRLAFRPSGGDCFTTRRCRHAYWQVYRCLEQRQRQRRRCFMCACVEAA